MLGSFAAPQHLRNHSAVSGGGRDMMLVANSDETVTFSDRDARAKAEREYKELMLCKCVMETLQRHYPGYPWMVKFGGGGVNEETGRKLAAGIEIKIPVLMGTKSYVIPVPMLLRSENESQRLIRQAGGEILDRFQIPRAAFRADAFIEAKDLRKVLSHKTPIPGG